MVDKIQAIKIFKLAKEKERKQNKKEKYESEVRTLKYLKKQLEEALNDGKTFLWINEEECDMYYVCFRLGFYNIEKITYGFPGGDSFTVKLTPHKISKLYRKFKKFGLEEDND